MSRNELQRVVAEKWRLTMRSGVSSINDNVIGDFNDYATALSVGGLLYEADKLDHPEYRSFDVNPIEAAQAVAPREWDEAMAAARAAVYGSDGRGMIGADRRHLVERVARAIQGVGDSDGLYLKCYGSLAKAVASAGFCINCKDGDIYLTPLAAAPASEAKGINGEALVERLEMLVVALKAEASVGRRGYNFGEDAANARAGSIAGEIEKAVHEVRVLGTSHPRTAEEAQRCKGASEPKPAASSSAGECKTCGGHGMIGYTTGQTPEQFEQHELPCPDCNEPDDAEQEQAGEDEKS